MTTPEIKKITNQIRRYEDEIEDYEVLIIEHTIYTPPNEPKLINPRKPPNFFKSQLLLLNIIAWLLPVLYVLFIINKLRLIEVFICLIILSFLTRLYNHYLETQEIKQLNEVNFKTNQRELKRFEVNKKLYDQIKLKIPKLRLEKNKLQIESKKLYNLLPMDVKEAFLNPTQFPKNSPIFNRDRHEIRGHVNRWSNSNSYENSTKDNKENIHAGLKYLSSLTKSRRKKILLLLKKINEVQNSKVDPIEKSEAIKNILWTSQSAKSKLMIGAFLGTVLGISVFGTGGIGIVGLGGAIGIWGFLAGTTGGILISSLIQNFEREKEK